MRILLIDDERVLVNVPADAEFALARNSADALKALKGCNHWDEIWFDHDLGGDDTTMRVVDFLSEKAFNGDDFTVTNVYVHSGNPVGVRSILTSLRNYGYNAVQVPIIGNLAMPGEDEADIFQTGYITRN